MREVKTREVSADNVIIHFECDDCGFKDWVSLQWLLDNGSLVCDCGCDMDAVKTELQEE